MKPDNKLTDLWIETYRPETLDDIIGHKIVVDLLKKYAAAGNSMNFMFSGPPGTGKTTMAIAFAKVLFGINFGANFIEFNASDDRGIDVVRNQIKNYAKTDTINANFKIIFLDEVDALTDPAQSALRRTMEKYHETCRFILSCNYDNKIIQPIKSRLTPFYISGLTPDDMKELIGRVCTKENITIDKDALETLIRMGDKDSRRIINTLQACAMLNKQIEKESVEKILQIPDRNIVKEMMIQATGNDIEKAFGIATNHIINSGFDIKKILIMMSDIILELDIEDFMRVKFIDILSTGEANINNGNTIDIQMKGMISKMNLVSKMNPKCML